MRKILKNIATLLVDRVDKIMQFQFDVNFAGGNYKTKENYKYYTKIQKVM